MVYSRSVPLVSRDGDDGAGVPIAEFGRKPWCGPMVTNADKRE
jgi:hypothetical protein